MTPSNSGKGQKIARCPVCRVALWSTYAGAGDALRFVRVGTLDDPDRLSPDIHIYTESKQPWVVIPAGVAHGFLALDQLELIYLVTNEFDGSDELGFAWDDPAVGVPWPTVAGTPDGRPILSDRDRSNPSLADLVAGLGGPAAVT